MTPSMRGRPSSIWPAGCHIRRGSRMRCVSAWPSTEAADCSISVVAEKIRQWLAPGGRCVHVGARTHEGAGAPAGPHPAPPRNHIRALVQTYLGPGRRAGQGFVLGGNPPDGEASIFRAAGLSGPEVIPIAEGPVLERSDEQVLASVLSLSSAAPHLFGDRLPQFVGDLRKLLREVSPSGTFSEQLGEMRLSLWHAD